ncbi:MAG: hypothetical protein HFJ42_09775 [Clostridia bacterium]|nr:hypothetical protein [Clostridia bacterium]
MKGKVKKQKNKFRKFEGITLISLIITIILLIILAGIVINLGLKENGLLSKAKFAKNKYINEQENEKKELNDLYSEVLVATGENSQITISVKELKEIINQEIEKSINQPTGTQIDAFIQNSIYNESNYENITSMSNLFTKTTDENNKIQEYLSYSNEDGYTVLKSGWYFVDMNTDISSSASADACTIFFLNETIMAKCDSWSSSRFRT